MFRRTALVAGALLVASVASAQQGNQQGATPPDSAQQRDTMATSVAERGARGQVSILREVFSYAERGRRDPMVSLISSADLRPLLTEVEVIGIIYSAANRANSRATLRNLNEQNVIYKVKEGDVLGRMTISQITPSEVVVTLMEIGTSRTERLPVKVKADTTARTP